MKSLLPALLLALLCAPLAAQDTPEPAGLKVGDEAVDLEVNNWVNTPAWPRFSELRGDVILVKAWGIN